MYMHVLSVLCVSQKVDDQNSMDTSENDSTAAEHSLPNNSEAAEVHNCIFSPDFLHVIFQQTLYSLHSVNFWSCCCLNDNVPPNQGIL